jgi:hypothetical protein
MTTGSYRAIDLYDWTTASGLTECDYGLVQTVNLPET